MEVHLVLNPIAGRGQYQLLQRKKQETLQQPAHREISSQSVIALGVELLISVGGRCLNTF